MIIYDRSMDIYVKIQVKATIYKSMPTLAS